MMPPNIPPPEPEPKNVVAQIWSRPKRVTVVEQAFVHGWHVSIEGGPSRRVDTVSVRGDFWTALDGDGWECEAQKVEIVEVEGLQICAIFCVPPADPPQS